VIGLDSTYKISNEAYSLSVFVCINQYGISEILAICLHIEEKTANFAFALRSYVAAGFNYPKIIFTDRSKALVKAVEDEWLR